MTDKCNKLATSLSIILVMVDLISPVVRPLPPWRTSALTIAIVAWPATSQGRGLWMADLLPGDEDGHRSKRRLVDSQSAPLEQTYPE